MRLKHALAPSAVVLLVLAGAAAAAAGTTEGDDAFLFPAFVALEIPDPDAPVPSDGALSVPGEAQYCYWGPGGELQRRAVLHFSAIEIPVWANATVVPARAVVTLDAQAPSTASCTRVDFVLLVTTRVDAGFNETGAVRVEARANGDPYYVSDSETAAVAVRTPAPPAPPEPEDAGVETATHGAVDESPADPVLVALLGTAGGVLGLALAFRRAGGV